MSGDINECNLFFPRLSKSSHPKLLSYKKCLRISSGEAQGRLAGTVNFCRTCSIYNTALLPSRVRVVLRAASTLSNLDIVEDEQKNVAMSSRVNVISVTGV